MNSECIVPSGRYILKGSMVVDVDQDFIYIRGLVENPSFKIDSAIRSKNNTGSWFIGYAAVGGGMRDSGKLETKL